jgi:6-pyruvoyltetrahydropterin/6-carboxytetrahydropterin synthase
MVYELSQTFHFEAAHTLVREIDAASSKLRGVPDPASGMLMDLGFFRRELAVVQEMLDHHLLDEVAGLGKPTLEGLCAFIAEKLRGPLPLLASVKVWRATGDSCKLIVG